MTKITKKKTLLVLAMVCLMSFSSVLTVSAEKSSVVGKYGGVSGSADNPPEGSEIDTELSAYYDRPVASVGDVKYWYLGGWWFTTAEIMKLPGECMLYNISPYALGSRGSGGNGGSCPNVQVPINPMLTGFVFTALFGIILFSSGVRSKN